MHADCRAQSRCDKCSAPFASSAALAKHKRFCDAASSVAGKTGALGSALAQFPFHHQTQNPSVGNSILSSVKVHSGKGDRSDSRSPDKQRHQGDSENSIVSPETAAFLSNNNTKGNPNPMEALRLDIAGLSGSPNNPNGRAGAGFNNPMHGSLRHQLYNATRHGSKGRHVMSPQHITQSPQSSPGLPNSKDDGIISTSVANNNNNNVTNHRKNPKDMMPNNKPLSAAFPGLMFPPSLPLYNPFAALPICPQLFAAVNSNGHPIKLGNGHGKTISDRIRNLANGQRAMSLSRSPTPPREHSPEKEDLDVELSPEEEPEEEIEEIKRGETPLDLSVQSGTGSVKDEMEEKTMKEEPDDLSMPSSNRGKRTRSPTPIRAHSPPKSMKESKDLLMKEIMAGKREEIINSLGDRKSGNRNQGPSPSPISPPHHALFQSALQLRRDGPPMRGGVDISEDKSSAFSQIIAPRPLHPFPRFSHPPAPFPALPHGFHPNPFNPFFHNTLSPRNELSNSLSAPNTVWQGKVGSR